MFPINSYMNKLRSLAFRGVINHFMCGLDHYCGTSFSKPFVVGVIITRACNSRCRQCDVWMKSKPIYELNTDEWKSIISKLHVWLGTFYLCISGGEPLLRRDIFKLIEYSNKKGIVTNMITNSYLINKNNAKKLVDSRLDRLTVSLDGIGEIHNYLRGFDGAFDKVTYAIKCINEIREKYNSKLRLSINTTITRYNLHQISEIIMFSVENNCSIYFRPVLPPYSTFSSKKLSVRKPTVNDELWPSSYKDVVNAVDTIIRMKKHGFPITNSEKHLELIKVYFKNSKTNFTNLGAICRVPSRVLDIKSSGDVFLCSNRLGNIIHDNIHNIQNNLRKSRISLRNCGKFCMLRDGNFNDNLFSEFNRFKTAIKL